MIENYSRDFGTENKRSFLRLPESSNNLLKFLKVIVSVAQFYRETRFGKFTK